MEIDRKEDPGGSMRRFALALVTVMTLVVLAGYARIQRDDAYIFYTYARNVADGHGWVFNDGERVNATTSVLYTLLLAFLYRILGFAGATLPLLGHLIGAAALWLTAWLSMRLFGRSGDWRLACLFPVFLLANPYLAYGTGMETFLTMALILLTLDLYASGRLIWMGAAAGLAVLSRPDAVLVPGLIFLDYAVRNRKLPPLKPVAAFLLVLLPWAAFSLAYFGSVLPSTLSAKMTQGASGYFGTGYRFLGELVRLEADKAPGRPLLILLALSAVYLLVIDRRWTRIPSAVLILAWGVVYLLAYGLVLNPPGYVWYYTPLALPMSLILALAAGSVLRRGTASRPAPSRMAACLALAAAVYGLAAPAWYFRQGLSPKFLGYRQTARYLNRLAPAGSSLAANEIGILGYYYARGRIIDALGLVTPAVAGHVAARDYAWYIREYRPDFLVFSHPHRPILESMVEQDWFGKMYRLARIVRTPGRKTAVWRLAKKSG